MRKAAAILIATLSTNAVAAAEHPKGPFVGLLLGGGAAGCDVPLNEYRCIVGGQLFRSDGPSIGLELGLALDHRLAVAIEAEIVSDYDELGSQGRIGPTIRYAPLPWIWVGAGPVIATETATLGASRTDLGLQIGGGFDARFHRFGAGVRLQHAWMPDGFSQLTVDIGLRWYFRRQR